MVNITDKVSDNEANILTAGSTKKISTQTISSTVASVDISIPTSGYEYVYVILDGIAHDTDNTDIALYLSDDQFTTTRDLRYALRIVHYSIYDQSTASTQTQGLMSYTLRVGNDVTNDDARGYSGQININIPTVSNFPSMLDFRTSYKTTAGHVVKCHGTIVMQDGRQLDTIRLGASAGNLTSGRITVYGVT